MATPANKNSSASESIDNLGLPTLERFSVVGKRGPSTVGNRWICLDSCGTHSHSISIVTLPACDVLNQTHTRLPTPVQPN